ncbi:MAG: fibrobacter succinogenes major paralogous domain-containing protein [Fibrobacter sp.]|nr:fibrobacter succinogenes major paralogous domain-containing protein [Fibrobacter sp.]
MKNFIAKMGAVLLSSVAALTFTACDLGGGLKDSRDGKTYRTVKIGDKVWMAENLNYQTGKSKCYENKPENCDKYGRLYVWREAVTACPDGWHLPNKQEFEDLKTLAGQKDGVIDKAGIVLKSTTGWNDYKGKSGNGTDGLGFGALPAGGYFSGYDLFDDDSFNSEGSRAYFWSSTESRSNIAYRLYLDYNHEGANVYLNPKNFGFSVRCVKNN